MEIRRWAAYLPTFQSYCWSMKWIFSLISLPHSEAAFKKFGAVLAKRQKFFCDSKPIICNDRVLHLKLVPISVSSHYRLFYYETNHVGNLPRTKGEYRDSGEGVYSSRSGLSSNSISIPDRSPVIRRTSLSIFLSSLAERLYWFTTVVRLLPSLLWYSS